MKKVIWIVAMLVVTGAVALGWAYSGQYNVAADAPHWDVTTRVLATVRERSIAVRAADLTVPNLADPALIALGAEHYAAMCTGCHLAPGTGDNEVRQGLYPKPPNLTEQRDRSPAESFWVIKHGVKMSGMPAWGVTHDDESLWGLVAFLQQLPALDAAGYAALTAAPGAAQHDHGEYDHGSTDHDIEGPAPAVGATMDNPADEGHAHQHPAGEGHDH
jgi:mono/diheme cytochrome c family protein